MTDHLFIEIRNLTESRACISVPLYKWEKKVQESCPDLTEHLTSISALYEYRDVHCSIIIKRMVVPNYRFLFEDYFHRTRGKKLWSLRRFFFFLIFLFELYFCRKISVNRRQNTLAVGSQILTCSDYLLWCDRVPDLSGLKWYLVIISHVSAVDWTQMSRSHLGSFRQLRSFRLWLGLLSSEGPTELHIPRGLLITACVGCGLGAQLGCWLELPCTWLFQVLGLPRIWKLGS